MGIEIGKVIDIIIGIVVLLVAINIAVLPVAKNTLGPLFSAADQTKQYLNDTGGKDFTPFDIEKSFGIAGLSITGLIDAVSELSRGIDDQIVIQKRCAELEKLTSVAIGPDLSSQEASTCISMGFGLKLSFRDMESSSYHDSLKELNEPLVDKGLFGKELNVRNFNTYLCDFFMHASTTRMNAFVYFTELPKAEELTTLTCKIKDNAVLTFHLQLNTLEGNIPDLKVRKSYRLSLVRRADAATFWFGYFKDITATGGIPSGTAMDVSKDLEGQTMIRGTTDEIFWKLEPIIYVDRNKDESLRNERFHLSLSKTDNDMVGCTQYFDEQNLRRDCYVSGFELPEKPYPKIDDLIDYFRAKAAAYRSPSYVFYFEAMPEGEESAWGYDTSVNLAKNIVIGGMTNAVFDLFGLVKAVGKTAKAAGAAKAAAALGKTTQDMVAKEAFQKLEIELLEEGAENVIEEFEEEVVSEVLSEGGEAATKSLESAYLINMFEAKKPAYDTLIRGLYVAPQGAAASRFSKTIVDKLEVELGRIVREEGADGLKKVNAEYLQKMGFTRSGLQDVGAARELVADDLQILAEQIQKEAALIPQREVIEKVMSSKSTVKAILTSFPQEQLRDKFDVYVTQRLLRALPDELDDKVMRDIMQRFSSESDVIFKQFEKEGFDVASFSGVNEQILDGVEQMITEKYSSAKFFKNIPIKSTLRKGTIITLLVLKDWLENVGLEKYYPQGRNVFVLFDPTSNLKKDRLATFNIESNFMPYINLNKPPSNNRFYLASPCKADVKVSKKICSCDVSSGQVLLKDGEFLRPAQNIPIPENSGKQFYLWDQLSEEQKVAVRSKYRSNVGFFSMESFQDSAKFNFYKDRLLLNVTEDAYYAYFRDLVVKFHQKGYYGYVTEMIPRVLRKDEDDYFKRMFDSTDKCYSGSWVLQGFQRDLFNNDFLRPVYEIDTSRLNADQRVIFLLFNRGSSGIDGHYLEIEENKPCEVGYDTFLQDMLFEDDSRCIRSSLSKEKFLEVYRKHATCYINYPRGSGDYDPGKMTSSMEFIYDWGILSTMDESYYEVTGLDRECKDSEYLKCMSGSSAPAESYQKHLYCNSYAIGKCNSEAVRDDDIIREWFVNYLYVDSEVTSTANVIYECNDPRSFGGEVKDTPLGRFQKSDSVDSLYYQKREGEHDYFNNHFSVSIPCVDVKTDNMNYPNYNDDYNFCHMGMGAVNAEKARKVASFMMTLADMTISIALNFIPGVGQAAMVIKAAISPVVSFGTGAAAAAIDTYYLEQFRWPKYQKNSMYDGWT
jgi:hypothetical protein